VVELADALNGARNQSVAIGWAYHPEVSFGRYVVVVNLRH